MNSLQKLQSDQTRPNQIFRVDLETGALCLAEGAAAELEMVRASFHKDFDTLLTTSNSLTATYHKLVEMHGRCERMVKDFTTLGLSNGVTTTLHNIQHVQTQKAQIERDMLEVEQVQCDTWQTIQGLHEVSKWMA